MRDVSVTCHGKDAFSSMREARSAVSSIVARYRRNRARRLGGDMKLSAYRCEVCGLFHVGRTIPKAQGK